MDAVFGFSSYRDPQIVATIEAFRQGLEYFATRSVSDGELDLAIIGVTGHHIRPLSPGQKGIVALRRTLYGITDELRQENHQTLLKMNGKQLQLTAGRLVESMAQSRVAVVAGAEAVARAAEKIPSLAERQTVLPV